MPVSPGTTIAVSFYNTLQTAVANILGPSGYGGTVTSSQLTISSIDTADQWDKLRADINACRIIQVGTAFTTAVLPDVASGQVISAADANKYEAAVDVIVDNYTGNMVLVNGAFTDTRTTSWSGTIDNEVLIDFGSVSAANTFFTNSGELRLNLSQTTTNTTQDQIWASNFAGVGTMIFNKTTTTRSGVSGIPQAVGWDTLTTAYQVVLNGNRIHAGVSSYYSIDDLYVSMKKNATGTGVIMKIAATNSEAGTISASANASYGYKRSMASTSPTFAFSGSNTFNLAVTGSGVTPSITTISATNTTRTSTTINVTANIEGFAFMVVKPAAQPAPTVAAWPGTSNNVAVSPSVPSSLVVPLPSPNTAYKVYVFVEDKFGNASSVSNVSVTSLP